MDIDKICRTCLSLSGPFMSIYDNSTESCLANMLSDFTKINPKRSDNMPDKVCLSCISEISHCYSFKLRCENSSRTLAQLLPNAIPEEVEPLIKLADKAVQTLVCVEKTTTVEMQTLNGKKSVGNREVQAGDAIAFKLHQVEIKPQLLLNVKSDRKKSPEEFISERKKPITRSTTKRKRSNNAVVLNAAENESEINLEAQEETEMNAVEEGQQQINANETSYYELSESQFVYDDEDQDMYIDEDANQSEFTIYDGETNHLRVEPKSKKKREDHKCPDCVMTFFSIKSLHRHMLKRHEYVAETASNPEEDDKFPTNEPMEKNEGQEEDTQEITTEEEHLVTNNSIELTPQPKTISTTPALIQYFCTKCNAGFANFKTLNFHLKLNTCTATNFKCKQCERVFLTPENLDEHMSTHEMDNVCIECNQVFNSTELLSEHMIQKHDRNVRNQCGTCKKVFTMFSALKDHMRIHSGEKPFKCNQCGRAFSQNANLKQHIMRHAKEKKFKCEVCSSSYVTKAELFSHKRIHTGDHPFKCEYCENVYSSNSSLMKHKRKHTGERPYACDICPLRFASLNVMKNHRRTHTGEKPFQCNYCSKSFTQKGDCKIHQRIHTGERLYTCCFCGDSFTHLVTLRMHKKLHDKENGFLAAEDGKAIKKENEKATHVVQITIQGDEEESADDGNGDETAEVSRNETQDDHLIQLAMENIC